MSARWKRNTVVATMVLLVCAAVALNWKYTGEQAADAVEETGTKILGEATLVSGQEDGGEAGTDEEAVYTRRGLLRLRPADPPAGQGQRHLPAAGGGRTSPGPTRRWPTRRRRASRCWRATP